MVYKDFILQKISNFFVVYGTISGQFILIKNPVNTRILSGESVKNSNAN